MPLGVFMKWPQAAWLICSEIDF